MFGIVNSEEDMIACIRYPYYIGCDGRVYDIKEKREVKYNGNYLIIDDSNKIFIPFLTDYIMNLFI